MKTKLKLNTGAFENIPAVDIDVEVEYSASEMLDMWKLTKTIAEESPIVFENFMVDILESYYSTCKKTSEIRQANEEIEDEVC